MNKNSVVGVILLILSVSLFIVAYQCYRTHERYWKMYVKKTLGDAYSVSGVVMPATTKVALGSGIAFALAGVFFVVRARSAGRAKKMVHDTSIRTSARLWTSTKDGHSFPATFLRQDAEHAYVKRDDGKIARLAKDRLVTEDREYLEKRERVRKQGPTRASSATSG